MTKKTRVEKPNERTFVLSHGISTFSLLGLINEKRKHDIHTLKRKLIQCVTRRRKKTERKVEEEENKKNEKERKSYMNMRIDACRTEKQKQKKERKKRKR